MLVKQLLVAVLASISMYAGAAPAALVLDVAENRVVAQHGDNIQRPIASLSKIMTAMVVLDSSVSMSDSVKLNRSVGSSLPQREYSRLELLHAMLVRSDNAAAETLAENHPGGRSVFLMSMNSKARELGLDNTQFADPSGLSIFNVSTLHEVGVMLTAANRYELIRSISILKEITLTTVKKKSSVSFFNTNYNILSQFKDIVVSKTGFTNPAGFCVGLILNRQGHEFAVVVLGEKNKQQRAATVHRLVQELF